MDHPRTHADRVLEVLRKEGVIRPRDLAALGVPRSALTRLTERGLVTQVSRGLYRLADTRISEHISLAEACRRVPHGIVCLLSALRFHGLTTQSPHEVWLAIDHKARRPRVEYPPIRIVHVSGPAREAGVETHVIDGVPVRIYSAAKTVADCFKFRRLVGLDAALEALRDYRRGRRSMDDLWRFARIDRMTNVMRPYIEALG